MNDTERALTDQHGELIRHTAQFWELLDDALHDGIMLREDLFDAGRQFLVANLDHMAHEERIAFACAREGLGEDDWTAIGAQPLVHDRSGWCAASIKQDCAMCS